MTYKFNSSTIYDLVGQLMQHVNTCKGLKQFTGIKHRITFKLYDNKGNLVDSYSGFSKGWTKLIKKDMHRIQTGTVESISSIDYTRRR